MAKCSNSLTIKALALLIVGHLVASVVACSQPVVTPTPAPTQAPKAAPTVAPKAPLAKEVKPEAKEVKPEPAKKEERKPVKLKVAYSAMAAPQSPLWVAKEKGVFEKYGLDVEPLYITSSSTLVQSMIAGDISLAQLGGPAVVNASLAGANLVIIAGTVNVLVYGMYSQPNIARVEDLRGKTVAVTRFGSVTDFAVRYTLRKYGLEPEKDVTLVQIGGLPEILGALQSGGIQGAMFAPPGTLMAKKLGMRELLDVADVSIPYLQTSVTVRKDYLAQNPEVVKDFLKGFIEGIVVIKKEKDFAMRVIGKYTETSDQEVLEDSYDIFANKVFPKVPYATVASMETILEDAARENPKAKGAKPGDFLDMRLVKELDESGFIDKLYAQ